MSARILRSGGVSELDLKGINEAKQFSEERFTKIDFIKNKKSTAFVLNFLPGQDMRAHHHPQKELFLYVLDGSGTFTVDGEEVPVKEGDVLYCEENEKIGFTNRSGGKVSIYGAMTKVATKQ